jgi:cytoskeletal protein CcmA (bactofilin family)
VAPAAPAAPQATPISSPAPSRASAPSVPQFSTPSSSAGGSAISSGLKIHGTVTGSADLTVDGELNGKIWLSDSRVAIGSNGRVHSDIEAREILVNGTLQGNLKASESVRFGPSARFQGSVVAPRIGIDDGAKVRGKIETVKPSAEPASAPAPKAKSSSSKSSAAQTPEASAAIASAAVASAAPAAEPASTSVATAPEADAAKAAAGTASQVTHS